MRHHALKRMNVASIKFVDKEAYAQKIEDLRLKPFQSIRRFGTRRSACVRKTTSPGPGQAKTMIGGRKHDRQEAILCESSKIETSLLAIEKRIEPWPCGCANQSEQD